MHISYSNLVPVKFFTFCIFFVIIKTLLGQLLLNLLTDLLIWFLILYPALIMIRCKDNIRYSVTLHTSCFSSAKLVDVNQVTIFTKLASTKSVVSKQTAINKVTVSTRSQTQISPSHYFHKLLQFKYYFNKTHINQGTFFTKLILN